MPKAPILNTDALEEGTTSAYFLKAVEAFDVATDAKEWSQSSRYIGVVTAIILYIVHFFLKKKYKVNWCSLLHAIVSGGLSFICVWLNVFSAESLTGTTEPLGAVLCQGALTTFHSIVPAITLGFGIFDLAEGFSLGKTDFILHGVATSFIMAYFCEFGVPEIIVPMLMMEISTVNLAVMRATFMSEKLVMCTIGMFSLNFLVFRIILCPYLWWGIFVATWDNRNNPESQACLPWHFTYVTFVFGMFFNCLNAFWFVKILLKIIRKLTGVENVKENSLKDS